MSVFLSAAMTEAVVTVPSANVTVTPRPVPSTWSAVTIVPLSATMMPVPCSRPARTVTTDGATRW
jgi:hypothetical protein